MNIQVSERVLEDGKPTHTKQKTHFSTFPDYQIHVRKPPQFFISLFLSASFSMSAQSYSVDITFECNHCNIQSFVEALECLRSAKKISQGTQWHYMCEGQLVNQSNWILQPSLGDVSPQSAFLSLTPILVLICHLFEFRVNSRHQSNSLCQKALQHLD